MSTLFVLESCYRSADMLANAESSMTKLVTSLLEESEDIDTYVHCDAIDGYISVLLFPLVFFFLSRMIVVYEDKYFQSLDN